MNFISKFNFQPNTNNENQDGLGNNNNGIIQQQIAQNPFQFNIGMAHQALLQHNTPFVNEEYIKPTFFKTRVSLKKKLVLNDNLKLALLTNFSKMI
jgi:hypothetical protein